MRGRQLFHSDLVRGLRALVRRDRKIRDLKSQHGLPTIQPHSRYVETLVCSILSQQISGNAAQTIIGRVTDAAGTLNDIHLIAELPDEILRGCGVSSQKLSYLRSLTEHILNNQLKLRGFSRLSDEEIIQELTAVKGIGVWTAKMFLIFSLGRLDVLAFEDLGVQHGVRKVYNLDHMPDKSEIERVAQENRWEPYCSIACWYMWRAGEA